MITRLWFLLHQETQATRLRGADPLTSLFSRSNLWPYWYEVVTVIWYSGLLLAELTNPGAKGKL